MVTMISFVLSLRFVGRCCGRLRCNCFKSHIHSSLLLSSSSFSFSFLCFQCTQCSLVLGFSLTKQFFLGRNLGLILFSFSELFLRFSFLSGGFADLSFASSAK